MKRSLSFLIVLFATVLAGSKAHAQADLVACGGDKVVMIDSRKSSGNEVAITWSWRVADATALPQQYQKLLIPLDECKPVDNGKKLLLTSSSGGVVLLDVATKKTLFHANAPMAHSAAILPRNRVVVALSTHKAGNSIEVYDLNSPEKCIYKDSLYSGHGVVWSSVHKRLFALGFDELRSYKLEDWGGSMPRLVLDRSWQLPGEGGHDLSVISENELLVSSHENVYSFNIKEGRFKTFDMLSGKHNIKSANFVKGAGKLVYTQAEESWWTHNIYIKNPDKTITVPDIKLYKVRLLK